VVVEKVNVARPPAGVVTDAGEVTFQLPADKTASTTLPARPAVLPVYRFVKFVTFTVMDVEYASELEVDRFRFGVPCTVTIRKSGDFAL